MFVEQLAVKLPYFRERHRMKPGIAGWAQLNYQYAASLDDARVKLHYDMYYLKNWSWHSTSRSSHRPSAS